MNLDLADFIIGCATLVVAGLSAILTYRLQRQKKRVEHLEKHMSIALDNLEVLYFLEKEYYAEQLETTHSKLQNEVRGWLEAQNMKLNRDHFRPSYIDRERVYLK